MRKTVITLAAALFLTTIGGGIATARPTVDRPSGNADRSNCTTVQTRDAGYLIQVRTTRVYTKGTADPSDDNVSTGWVTKRVQTLPAPGSGVVYRIIRDNGLINQTVCR